MGPHQIAALRTLHILLIRDGSGSSNDHVAASSIMRTSVAWWQEHAPSLAAVAGQPDLLVVVSSAASNEVTFVSFSSSSSSSHTSHVRISLATLFSAAAAPLNRVGPSPPPPLCASSVQSVDCAQCGMSLCVDCDTELHVMKSNSLHARRSLGAASVEQAKC